MSIKIPGMVHQGLLAPQGLVRYLANNSESKNIEKKNHIQINRCGNNI